jgi:hypothetical protein
MKMAQKRSNPSALIDMAEGREEICASPCGFALPGLSLNLSFLAYYSTIKRIEAERVDWLLWFLAVEEASNKDDPVSRARLWRELGRHITTSTIIMLLSILICHLLFCE